MAGFFEALFKFFSEFTWRKLLAVIVVVCVVFVGFSLFERYTSSFRLTRLQKAADLLIRVQELQARGTNNSPEVDHATGVLISQVTRAVETEPTTINFEFVPSRLTFSIDWFWKFLAGSALWFVLSFSQITKLKTKDGRNAFFGALVMAVVSGSVGICVRAFWWPWFHLLIYPWLLIAAIFTALAPFALMTGMRAGKKAQGAACISNLKQLGLAARIWANDHRDELPEKFVDMATELKTMKITFCPRDKAMQYIILSPGASQKDPSVVYAICPIHNHVVLVDGTVRPASEVDRDERGIWRTKKVAA